MPGEDADEVETPPAPSTPAAPALAAEPEADDEPAPPTTPLIDRATGRDLANYPPHPLFDHMHLRIAMHIDDMESQRFDGEAALTCVPVGTARSVLTLDAAPSIKVKSIRVDGLPAQFEHVDHKLTITLPEEAKPAPAAPITVAIAYDASRTSSEGAGLVWLKTRPSRAERGPQIFSQGQANFNHYWFPCHDFPNDRLTTELIVTVPDGFTVLSNGRLIGSTPARTGFTTWHWSQEQSHASYLVMVAVARFDIVELNTGRDGPPSKPALSMPVYGPVGTAERLRDVYKNTPRMITYFEQLFDEPYPWAKYAQVIVRGFNWGGMENTSATVMTDASLRGGDEDDLIAHELAHQWMGDLITCRTWEHLWLNEGWATFGEAMWREHVGGDKGYYDLVRSSVSRLRAQYKSNPAKNPGSIPVVSNRYKVPDDAFNKRDDVYAKGGFILHMLRERLGDEVFWKGVRLYIDRYKFGLAETDDFRKCLEEVSGESLQRFFAQWCHRAGMPHVRVSTAWAEAGKKLVFTIDQVQPIDDFNPAYAFRLPIECVFEGGAEPVWVDVPTQERTASMTVSLPAKPVRLRVDPSMTVLANFEVEGDVEGKGW